MNYTVTRIFSSQIPFIWCTTHTYWAKIVIVINLPDLVLVVASKGGHLAMISYKLRSVPYPSILDNPWTRSNNPSMCVLSSNHYVQRSTYFGISRRRPFCKIVDSAHQVDSRSILRSGVCSPLKYLSFGMQHIHIKQALLKSYFRLIGCSRMLLRAVI